MSFEVKLKGRHSAMNELEADLLKEAGVQTEKEKRTLVSKLADATPKDTGRAAAGWKIEGKAITNDVPYIVNLNDGSSQQAPPYFVERTLLAHKGVFPSGIIVRRK